MTERVLVTGAVGFIGYHVCRRLLARGHTVIGYDNFDPFYDPTIKRQARDELTADRRFTFVDGDVRSRDTLDRALAGVDVVVHLAGRAGVRQSVEDPEPYRSINVAGTVGLLEGCRARGIRRVVFTSSSSIYGNAARAPVREHLAAASPISPYAASKLMAEGWCRYYGRAHGFRIAALRPFSVYGPRQRPDQAIHRFTRALSTGRPVIQFGDGSSARDYTHVEDVVQGAEAAMAWTRHAAPGFEAFNLGESQSMRLDGVIEMIARALGVPPRVERAPWARGDVRQTWADIRKARRILGYRPRIPVAEGIPHFVRWYEEHHGRPS